MQVSKFDIEGPLLIEGVRHHDNRGFFSETYQKEKFLALDIPEFVQDNLSHSARGVFRGLHWQESPHGQGKLVTCLAGEIVDFVVDVRADSPTFLEQLAIPLSASKLVSVWVPEGFAHGFLSLQDDTVVQYKVTNYWHKDSERSLSYKLVTLPEFAGMDEILLSDKDAMAPTKLINER